MSPRCEEKNSGEITSKVQQHGEYFCLFHMLNHVKV